MAKAILTLVGIACGIYLAVAVFVFVQQRSMLYLPSHSGESRNLRPWIVAGEIIGYSREVSSPSSVWLMAHGNAGEAANRGYVVQCLPTDASVYVVEYPGFGLRPGSPTEASLNRAVRDAYDVLVKRYSGKGIGVIGESIGSGPACALAGARPSPAKIVLIVPFDTLVSVASDHMPLLPVGLLLRDRWNNIEALKGYSGAVEVYGATLDGIIPVEHAKRLAAAVGAKLTLLNTGHNDWVGSSVQIR